MKKLLPLFAALPIMALAQTPNIGEFTSVEPVSQQATNQIFELPSTHTFQKLFQRGLLPGTGDTDADNFDFTGFIPNEGSSTSGWLSINHETSPGGVSLLTLDLDLEEGLWNVGEVRTVDFTAIESTVRNCSGGVTPWETVVTSEESIDANDANGDGYFDIGWQVEIDPRTGAIKDYDNDGTPDKVWRMGNMSHENFVVNDNGTIAYEGADMGSTGFVYRYVLDEPNNLQNGALYVLSINAEEITEATSARWIPIPNETPEECNNVLSVAEGLGATNFNGVEDVEVGPDGFIYFTAKGTDRVYRFTDVAAEETEIPSFQIHIDNVAYTIEHVNGSTDVNFQDPDNLDFDNQGNLYILQDGGNNYIWVTGPEHTKDNPDIRIFANTPGASESTGITFTPDGKFMFISIQHPGQFNLTPVTDAAGNVVQYFEDITVVVARKEVLGQQQTTNINDFKSFQKQIKVLPNPVAGNTLKIAMPEGMTGLAEAVIIDNNGRVLVNEIFNVSNSEQAQTLDIGTLAAGSYTAIVRFNDLKFAANFIRK